MTERDEYLLSLELDGDLSPAERLELYKALELRPDLLAVRQDYRTLQAGLDLIAVEDKVDFDQLRTSILREVRKTSLAAKGPAFFPMFMRVAAVLALAATVVGVLVVGGSLGPATSNTPMLAPNDAPGDAPLLARPSSMGNSVRIELPDLPAVALQPRVLITVESPFDTASADAALLHQVDPDASRFRVLIGPARRFGPSIRR